MDFPILGRHNDRLKQIRSLNSASSRERAGVFLVEGLRVVGELLASKVRINLLLLADDAGAEAQGLAQEAVARGGEVYRVERQLLEQLAPTKTCQGVLAVAQLPAGTWEQLSACKRLIILDGVQDPGNVGTLLRSARAFGFEGALCLGGADPFNARAVRAAAGAVFTLPLVRVSDAEQSGLWLERALRAGFSLVTAAAHGGEDLAAVRFPERLALVLGAEVSGISKEADARALVQVTIDLKGGCESLNVAAAGAVLMYEINRRGIGEF